MNAKSSKNNPASIHQRLLNKARNEQRPFNELLQYYAMERFLYRLSQSSIADKFILKGALMLRVWGSPEFRPTKDIDMLGRTSNEENNIIKQIQEILSVDVPPDGLTFNSDSIQAERIAEDADYEGIRIGFQGSFGSAKVKMQIDIGFSDIIFPKPQECDLPTLLDFPPPKLLCYSRESAIAEKFEAMLKLGELNSRMKEFYDIWLLSRQFDFEGEILTEALRLTLEQRHTNLREEIVAFTDEFVEAKQGQWKSFCERIQQKHLSQDFALVISTIKIFLSPVISALLNGTPIPTLWIAASQWI